MPDPIITNVDLGEVVIECDRYRDATLRFDAADTFVKGTILARRVVEGTPTATPDGGNTGDGTLTALSTVEGPIVPLAGDYVLRCTEAVTNGGVFELVNPDGAIVASGLRMTPGAGGATILEAAGLRFTLTDGSADFVVGDEFTITVTADGSLVPFAPGGAGGEQIPVAVLAHEATRASAGTERVRVVVKASVKKERLVIDADGDASNVTDAVIDQLRNVGITAIDTAQHAVLDNQP